jgi:hypothetical protein
MVTGARRLGACSVPAVGGKLARSSRCIPAAPRAAAPAAADSTAPVFLQAGISASFRLAPADPRSAGFADGQLRSLTLA